MKKYEYTGDEPLEVFVPSLGQGLIISKGNVVTDELLGADFFVRDNFTLLPDKTKKKVTPTSDLIPKSLLETTLEQERAE